MNEEILEMVRQAREALAAGADPRAIDARFAELSEGKFASLQAVEASLQAARGPTEGDQVQAAGERVSKHSPVSNFLRLMAQGMSGNTAHMLSGASMMGNIPVVNPVAAEKSKQRVDDLRKVHPGTSALVETGSAFMLPGAGIRSAFARGGAVRSGAVAGGIGAAAATADNIGEGEAPIQENVPITAAISALTAGLGDKAVRFLGRNRNSSPGQRVAQVLERETGVTRDINRVVKEASEEVERVRDEFYKPLETKYGAIANDEVKSLIRSPLFKKITKSIEPSLLGKNGADPAFTQLQAMQSKLRGRIKAAKREGRTDLVEKFGGMLDQLTGVMETNIPGVREANSAYAKASQSRIAVSSGRKFGSSAKYGAADLERAIEQLPEEAHKNFRTGFVYERIRKLEAREDGSVRLIKQLADAGKETKAVLRKAFPDDESFERFLQVVKKERSADRIANAFKKYSAAGAAAAGAGGAVWLFKD
jgi:hypothetical protein